MISSCSNCSAQNRVPFAKLGDHPKCGRCKQALPPPSQALKVADQAEFDKLVSDSPWPVVVDFWAAWCGPCRMVAPELERLAGDKSGQVLIAKVDTEALPQLAQRYQVRSIPTLVRFDSGRESKRVSGAMKAEQLAQALGI